MTIATIRNQEDSVWTNKGYTNFCPGTKFEVLKQLDKEDKNGFNIKLRYSISPWANRIIMAQSIDFDFNN